MVIGLAHWRGSPLAFGLGTYQSYRRLRMAFQQAADQGPIPTLAKPQRFNDASVYATTWSLACFIFRFVHRPQFRTLPVSTSKCAGSQPSLTPDDVKNQDTFAIIPIKNPPRRFDHLADARIAQLRRDRTAFRIPLQLFYTL